MSGDASKLRGPLQTVICASRIADVSFIESIVDYLPDLFYKKRGFLRKVSRV